MIGDLLSQGSKILTGCMHCLGLKSYLLPTEDMPLAAGGPETDETTICQMFWVEVASFPGINVFFRTIGLVKVGYVD
jgi:hypothetical protein